ncbi:hypothetical protein [Okeania sp. KiyG1]|uniref:hypothetical protein n=1 Tax=Okeania sp. KiyG1 TaxID=2720165 RepID=UPI0019245014|nr:hypothetical protein [Okeania sp. KiyG1]GGA54082.1 hypothetical protein CYANOKiyG1_74270 [Okeania sp. KiyG1]
MTLTPNLKKLINESVILASLSELNLEQEEQLGEILEQASQKEILAFSISEVDYLSIDGALHFINAPYWTL